MGWGKLYQYERPSMGFFLKKLNKEKRIWL